MAASALPVAPLLMRPLSQDTAREVPGHRSWQREGSTLAMVYVREIAAGSTFTSAYDAPIQKRGMDRALTTRRRGLGARSFHFGRTGLGKTNLPKMS